MRALTYDGWQEIGYYVRRGERASGRDELNQPTFTRDQVEERNGFDHLNLTAVEREELGIGRQR